ncbi:MAG: hypothetical protein M1826_007169 [Phylliscum demangeonii]|nr:MAG: hypothetical protein M1826_007169 [Phylliscum demangeonii]
MASSSAAFTKAVQESRQLTAKPTNDELLQLYALYKQGSQDPAIEKAPNPGAFDLKGKAKKGAWQKLVDADVTPEQAQERYVQLVEKLKAAYGFDEAKELEAVGE